MIFASGLPCHLSNGRKNPEKKPGFDGIQNCAS